MRSGLPGASGVGRDECGKEGEAGGGGIGRGGGRRGGHFRLRGRIRERKFGRVSGTGTQ